MSSLLTPDTGLLFWMLLTFGVVVFVLVKFGFPVILKMVEERKTYIEESLLMAEKAREELEKVSIESTSMLENARKEQLKIINDASKTSQQVIKEARELAKKEAIKIIEDARSEVLAEKENALREIRLIIADLSVDIAEKLIKTQLDNQKSQDEMIHRLLDDINIPKS
ncbi:MAG: F0F1 ATP synthase subunit B [Paludibacter sp.]|nr:F0F1 ATP synthase subunit B [Paludibacter sp.]